MNPIEKELQKLSAKERAKIKELITKLLSNQTKGLDIKKLKGSSEIYRVRKGNFRILYRLDKERIFIVKIDRRNEGTYKT